MSVKIGNVKVANRLVLAPMEAVNCIAFRLLCRRYGAGLLWTAMIDAEGITRTREKLLNFSKKEKPLVVQLVGNKPEKMKEAASIVDEYADIIDINFGCPKNDVVGQKKGAYFIKHPNLMDKIVRGVMSGTNKPVSAKIRIGWDSQSINAVKVAKQLEDLGVSAIAVHGRTREQQYMGKANWTAIKQVKDNCGCVVIGNGDVFEPEDAKKMIDLTGCDMVMIGRGARANPYIFKQINDYLADGKYGAVSKKNVFFDFLELYEKYEKNKKFSEIRDHALWYATGIDKAKKIKNDIMQTKNLDGLKKVFERVK